MGDQGVVWLGAVVGAVAGGLFGYLYFTENGRRLREDLEPQVADLLDEFDRARVAAIRAKAAVDDSWASVRRVETSLRGRSDPA